MEIEKRFLVNSNSIINKITKEYHKKEIVQDYLYVDKYTAIRKRKINEKYIYTLKTMKTGISVNEFEKEITKEEYESLKINENFYTLTKDRYIIPYLDNLKIEIDIFHGIYEGIIFAEIEFKDEKQAKEIKLPEWFGKDISTLITNSQMATKNMKDEIEKLKKCD